MSHNNRAHAPQLPKPAHPRALALQQREAPAMRCPHTTTRKGLPLAETRESPRSTKTQHGHKKMNKIIIKKKKGASPGAPCLSHLLSIYPRRQGRRAESWTPKPARSRHVGDLGGTGAGVAGQERQQKAPVWGEPRMQPGALINSQGKPQTPATSEMNSLMVSLS